MSKLELEIPEELVQSLKLPRDEVPARLKRELALRLYEKGLLSFGKARELAGMTKWEFSYLLGKKRFLATMILKSLTKTSIPWKSWIDYGL